MNSESCNGERRDADLEQLAQVNFQKWNDALATLNPQTVSELYTDNTSFLPTLNPELKRGQDGAEQYFHHFLEKKPTGKITEEVVHMLSSDQNNNPLSYAHSGLYNFEVGEPSNRKEVEARFTFIWQKDSQGQWKILHHHSSLRPKE